ncbi:hypothetical protein RRG08_010608 [Elysia crispata]|uniref:Uncharacterized protein n=1 Tax=Elysia crispata TaxID=231223 RepID=A0AAE1E182_9GAST|nr:hypothetical protein RRG08_010608 [Elysia crispata]
MGATRTNFAPGIRVRYFKSGSGLNLTRTERQAIWPGAGIPGSPGLDQAGRAEIFSLTQDRSVKTEMATLKTFGFGLRAFKKYPELVPLVSIISTAVIGCCSFMGYALATKPDVRVIKSKGPAFEDVGPLETRKLVNLNKDKYQIFPEVEALRREIGSYKS